MGEGETVRLMPGGWAGIGRGWGERLYTDRKLFAINKNSRTINHSMACPGVYIVLFFL